MIKLVSGKGDYVNRRGQGQVMPAAGPALRRDEPREDELQGDEAEAVPELMDTRTDFSTPFQAAVVGRKSGSRAVRVGLCSPSRMTYCFASVEPQDWFAMLEV
jgi:hypothetical protein